MYDYERNVKMKAQKPRNPTFLDLVFYLYLAVVCAL
jgi:hypothetical protein